MVKKDIKQQYASFIQELECDFHHKKQEYVRIIKIGQKISPYSIPPQLEVILLDPEEQEIAYRMASDPDSIERKKGDWKAGATIDAVTFAIDWADAMKKARMTY